MSPEHVTHGLASLPYPIDTDRRTATKGPMLSHGSPIQGQRVAVCHCPLWRPPLASMDLGMNGVSRPCPCSQFLTLLYSHNVWEGASFYHISRVRAPAGSLAVTPGCKGSSDSVYVQW